MIIASGQTAPDKVRVESRPRRHADGADGLPSVMLPPVTARGRGRWLWVAGAMLALSACSGEPAREPAPATLPAGETMRVLPREVADMKPVAAEVVTRDQAEVIARIPGILATLSVRAGDTVRKGQRIGLIVDDRLGDEARAYAAQTAAAEAEAVRADADLARIRDLHENGVYAKARLEQAEAAARAADAMLTAARAQRDASRSVAGQGAVIAPADGRVLRADIPAGAPVVPGMTVATITAGPPILRLMLPESVAGQIRPGARVVIREGDSPQVGSVVQVYPAITGGEVRADATLPGLSTRYVGRRVDAAVEIGTRHALVVPRRFVVTRYGMDQVRIVGEEKRLSMVPVRTAPAAGSDMLEILSGVAAGDTLFAADAAGAERP